MDNDSVQQLIPDVFMDIVQMSYLSMQIVYLFAYLFLYADQ